MNQDVSSIYPYSDPFGCLEDISYKSSAKGAFIATLTGIAIAILIVCSAKLYAGSHQKSFHDVFKRTPALLLVTMEGCVCPVIWIVASIVFQKAENESSKQRGEIEQRQADRQALIKESGAHSPDLPIYEVYSEEGAWIPDD